MLCVRIIAQYVIIQKLAFIKLLYLTPLCLNRLLSCVDFMNVIMGDIPLFPYVNSTDTIFSIKLLYNLTTLCLNGTIPWVDLMDIPKYLRKVAHPVH